MKSELKKELQDAGFKWEKRLLLTTSVCDCTPYTNAEGNIYHNSLLCNINSPTLEELIDACGEAFISLERPIKEKKWWAEGYGNGYIGIAQDGKTPEEAVARLWLALNAK